MAKCFATPPSWSDEGKYGSSSSSPKGPFLLPSQAKLSSSSSVVRNPAALRIHSEAEKRRRVRINAHLSTLRRMIPNSSKMDKASLLGEVIDHLKDLKRKALDIDQSFTIPAERDEVNVEFDSDNGEKLYIRASVCCDDRPDLFEDLVEAFGRLRLRTVRADIMRLGGRAQNKFILCLKDCDGSVCSSSLSKSIREVLGRVASSSSSSDVLPSNVFSSKGRKVMRSQ